MKGSATSNKRSMGQPGKGRKNEDDDEYTKISLPDIKEIDNILNKQTKQFIHINNIAK